MRRAVGAHEAGAVEREAHGQVLDGDVVDDLVVAALQEGRVDRRERLDAVGREARGEGHRVLLGDADVEEALAGIAWPKRSRPVPEGMAAVMATILSHPCRASAIRLSPKHLV